MRICLGHHQSFLREWQPPSRWRSLRCGRVTQSLWIPRQWGPVRQAIGLPEPRVHDLNARIFRAVLPGQSGGLVEYLPVLRFAGQPISPGLGESAQCPRYQVGRGAVETADPSPASSAERAGEPRWDWGTRFLWSATIIIRKEVVGELPDGLRINWNVVEGSFAGPGHEGIVLPGATDLMRIRKDGIGVVNVTEVLQTRRGARLYCSYGGIFELGAAGYARALLRQVQRAAHVRGHSDLHDR